MTTYEQVLEKFKNENINVDDYDLFIIGKGYTLNDRSVQSFTFSKDEKWICLPVLDEEFSASFGNCYKPVCFEIEEKYECYVGSGMLYRAEVYLLNKGA